MITNNFLHRNFRDWDEQDSGADKFSENAKWLLNQRYYVERCNESLDGVRKEKTPDELIQRVARVIASAETQYLSDAPDDEEENLAWLRELELNIRSDILNQRFLFNSPCLFNAGAGLTTDKVFSDLLYKPVKDMTFNDYFSIYDDRQRNQQLFACFVIDVPDSIDGIFQSVKDAGIISKFGGGVGMNFGHIRERGAKVRDGGNGGIASGPVSFMRMWDTMADVVVQGGKRRAALMGMLPIDHPDIEEFINCKTEDGKLPYFNISVAVTDNSMQWLELDDTIDLTSPLGDNTKTVGADYLFNKLCESAWNRGDPGVFFIDTAQDDNLLKLDDTWRIEATNPCGEQPLPNYTSCNLGSINLASFVEEDGTFDWDEFKAQIYRSMYYLDLVIDASVYPLEKIEQRTKAIRPIGLGIMGLADAAIMMNMVYGSKEFKEFCENIAETLAATSLEATVYMAREKGAFPEHELVEKLFKPLIRLHKLTDENFNEITKDKFNEILQDMEEDIFNGVNGEKYKIPVSITKAMKAYAWRDWALYQDLNRDFDKTKEILKAVLTGQMRNSRRLSIAPTGSISMLLDTSSGIEPNFAWSWDRRIAKTDGSGYETKTFWHKLLADYQKEALLEYGKQFIPYFVTAHEVPPEKHVEVMGIFAPYIDSGISKTVNLPNSATVEDVKKIYQQAYKLGCKGITIYRDGSRTSQPIEVKDNTKDSTKDNAKDNVKDNVSNEPEKTELAAAMASYKKAVKESDPEIDESDIPDFNEMVLSSLRVGLICNESNPITLERVYEYIPNYFTREMIKEVLDSSPHVVKHNDGTYSFDGTPVKTPGGLDINGIPRPVRKPPFCHGCSDEQTGCNLCYREYMYELADEFGIKTPKNDQPALVTGKTIKERPSLIVYGKTIKETTPWGSIYVTMNFDGTTPFEVFINVGKSGSELKAMTEALSRVISIGLRSGVQLKDFIGTLKGLSGKEYWMLGFDDTHVARSIPDVIAMLLEKLIEPSVKSSTEDSTQVSTEVNTQVKLSQPDAKAQVGTQAGTEVDTQVICPECGSPMELISGCKYCFSCGYSPCK